MDGERRPTNLYRLVGGPLNLFREMARVNQYLEPAVPAEWIIKRIQFYSYELQSRLQSNQTERDRLALLNHFFFEEKKFICSPKGRHSDNPQSLLSLAKVFNKRTGSPSILALLYSYLAERVDVPLSLVNLKPTCLLKWNDGGRSRFIDMNRNGVTISSDELIELLHSRFQMTSVVSTSLLEDITFDTFITDYLVSLRATFDPALDLNQILFLQDTLIEYLPSQIQLLAERAQMHQSLGNTKLALNDLKRFFSFCEKDKAPQEIVALYEELLLMYERNRPNFDLI